jgi:hypothetical protein
MMKTIIGRLSSAPVLAILWSWLSGDLATGQVEIGAVALAERLHHVGKRGLLAVDHKAVFLAGLEVGEVDGRLDVFEIGDGHLDCCPESDLDLRRAVAVHHDDRRRVALVNDPVEWHVAEPPRGLARLDLEPLPIIGIVEVARAIWLAQAGARHERVVQTAQVDRLDDLEPRHLLGEPSAVTVACRRILAVGIDLLVQDGEVGEGEACLPRRDLENPAKRALPVAGGEAILSGDLIAREDRSGAPGRAPLSFGRAHQAASPGNLRRASSQASRSRGK